MPAPSTTVAGVSSREMVHVLYRGGRGNCAGWPPPATVPLPQLIEPSIAVTAIRWATLVRWAPALIASVRYWTKALAASRQRAAGHRLDLEVALVHFAVAQRSATSALLCSRVADRQLAIEVRCPLPPAAAKPQQRIRVVARTWRLS